MTNEEAIDCNNNLKEYMKITDKTSEYKFLQENYEALDMGNKALEQQSTDEKTYLKRREGNYVEYNIEWFLKNWELEIEILSGGKIKPTDADCISRAQALHACCDEWNKDYKAIMKSIRQLPSVTPKAESEEGD